MSEWPQILPLMDSTSPIGLICDIMYSAMNRSMNFKTIVVNLVLISPYGSNDLAHSLHSFVRTSISVKFGNIFELGQKNACCINVPNPKMILIYHIGRQNKMRYSYSGSKSSMPSEGLKG